MWRFGIGKLVDGLFGGWRRFISVVIMVWVFEANVAINSHLEIDKALSNGEPEKVGESATVMYHASFEIMK